ncbi:MAG: hypothetical protein RL398_2332 [Planctomycetota bacterium]|jgi:YHS domain-containing protein
MRFSLALFAALAACAAPPSVAPPQPGLALTGLDPIELAADHEVAGRPSLTAVFEDLEYRFATAATLAKFRSAPADHAAQLGGACARMGPLSGLGSPDRWLVHDGRIYLFASEACRNAFAKRPEAFLPPTEPRPTPSSAEAAAGRELLDRAVAAHGGAARLRAWRDWSYRRTGMSGQARRELRLIARLPDAVRIDDDWFQDDQEWRYRRVVASQLAFFVDTGTPRPMHEDAQFEMRCGPLREPAYALRRALDGEATVFAAPDASTLVVWQHGCRTEFTLSTDGTIASARFVGRGPSLTFGTVERRYGDYVDCQGIRLPTSVEVTFEGKPAESLAERRLDQAVDVGVPAAAFSIPQ